CSSLCFFFQAEDGIRDRNVTGVQTCALPISGTRQRDPAALQREGSAPSPCRAPAAGSAPGYPPTFRWTGHVRPPQCPSPCPRRRSEERRVGKECRYERSSDLEKQRQSQDKFK